MGVVGAYFSDEEVISSLRRQFPRYQQYRIDFLSWLHTARLTSDGFVVQVFNRKFLVDKYTGSVIREYY